MMYTSVEQKGNDIIDIYYDDKGAKRLRKCDYKPIIGLEGEEESEFKGLLGENLHIKQFENIREYYDFVRSMENNIKIHGNIQPVYQYISEKYKEINFNLNFIRPLSIDIEVYCEEGFPSPYIAAWPITSISIKDMSTSIYYVAATKPYDKMKTELNFDAKKIYFKTCKDDSEILIWLVKVFQMLKPDILVGWYSDNFDFPYIINRFDYIFEDENVKNKLSPIGIVNSEQLNNRDFRNYIGGITLFDYMRLYKKYIFTPRERYSLDFIAQAELGETKIDYSEYDDLNHLWRENPQKYVDYNIYDVELIDMLDKKLGLLKLACTVAYMSKCNFIDIMGTIKPWDCIAYNYLKERNILIPPRNENERIPFAGAYVKEPVTGIYDWVVSYDLNSLYPHIQQQWNISPECLVKGIRENVGIEEISPKILNQQITPNENYIMAGNGCYFRKDKPGFIPTILREMYDNRAKTKSKMMVEKQTLVDLKEEMKKRGLEVK